MNFGSLNNSSNHGRGGDGGSDGVDFKLMATSAVAQPRLVTQSFPKSMFTTPRLSLALQTNIDGLGIGDMIPVPANGFETNVRRRTREEEPTESRSGSDNMDGGGSGDDQDAAADNPKKKKRYHRHTPQQIQELEAMFKECPHPDEKQRSELSRRLSLETRQVKFWFQNRRTQMKTQLERHENTILRQENDKLRAENMSIREAMRNPNCSNCGGPAIIGEISLEEQQLRIENIRLKDELDRVCALAGKFIGRPIAPPCLELGVGGNNSLDSLNTNLPDFGGGIPSNLLVNPSPTAATDLIGVDRCIERSSMYLELALTAMDELVKMAHTDEPLWIRSLEGSGREIMNNEEYMKMFSPCIGMKPNGFVMEASRETGLVIINSLALVETLMDSNRWSEMFPSIVAVSATTDVISGGMGGTRNGALQLMHGELQVLSPMVPVREMNFLRFCKQHAEGVWGVVDVSIDAITDASSSPSPLCRRLPSGCLVHDMPNGYSKVIWVEHTEYDESHVHQLYRPLLISGLGFGARRWVTALQRQCDCLAVLISSSTISSRDHTAITASGRRSMLKLAQRMTANFCAGVCASTVYKWNRLNSGNVGEDIRVMTRRSVDDPGEPPGTVLSAATAVWLPAPPQRLFDFLRDDRLRSEWDILSNGGPMQDMLHIAKGHDHRNSVSLLRAAALNSNQSNMLILQETCTDAIGSLVIYAPVDIPAMQGVMNGGDSAYVALLPSGFAIVPDGVAKDGSASLLTVAFQILVNSLPTEKLTVESVHTVKNLISCTVQKIKAAIGCET